MRKPLLLSMLLLLASCREGAHTPLFKVGDCVQGSKTEEWESPGLIERIEQIGQKAYRTSARTVTDRWVPTRLNLWFWEEDFYHKVECPRDSS